MFTGQDGKDVGGGILRADMENEDFFKTRKKKERRRRSHLPIMSFSRNIELSSVNGWGASRVWGLAGWLQSRPNERARCLMQRERDERGEGDGEFVGHQSPLLSPSHPAALPRSAHVSWSSNAGPTAARMDTHTQTHSRKHALGVRMHAAR